MSDLPFQIPSLVVLHILHLVSNSAFVGAGRKGFSNSQLPRQFIGGDLAEDEVLSDILLSNTNPDDTTAKWLAIALIFSAFLNGYLMRVISFAARINQVSSPTAKQVSSANQALATVAAQRRKRQSATPAPKAAPMHIDIPLPKPVVQTVITESPVDVSPQSTGTASPAMTLVNTPASIEKQLVRGLEECLNVYGAGNGVKALNDEEIISLCQAGKIQAYALEKSLGDHSRAVKVRRAILCE